MEVNNNNDCVCGTFGWTRHCPCTFFIEGQPFHTLHVGGEKQIRSLSNSSCTDATRSQEDGMADVLKMVDREIGRSNITTAATTQQSLEGLRQSRLHHQFMPAGLFREPEEITKDYSDAGTGFISDEGLGANSRVRLSRFQALEINGVTINQASVGGYRIDPTTTLDNIQRCAKLPPVVLSKIFTDGTLTLLHHFFSCWDSMLGQDFIIDLVTRENYVTGEYKELFEIIKNLILAGTLETDDESVTLLKRILSATFDTVSPSQYIPGREHLVALSNFYGLPYVEPGQRFLDSDLAMWLNMTYADYKKAWFNSFKSTGLPRFAKAGVQDRYGSNRSVDGINSQQHTPKSSGELIVSTRKSRTSSGGHEEYRDEYRRHKSGEKKSKRSAGWSGW
jgi:hypothetical protein